MDSGILTALVLIFGVSGLSVLLLERLRIPPLVGFIIAGALIGPNALGIVEDLRTVEAVAEIGVILLLFAVGIEFSTASLIRMRRAAIYGGGVQMALAVMVTIMIIFPLTANMSKSVFMGFLISLSSTAIVLKMLFERGEADTPQGRMMVGILIFQDLCVVPLMLLTPALSGAGVDIASLAVKMLVSLLIIAGVLVSARWFVPAILHRVVRTKSRELFTFTIIFLCFGIALLTSKLGLSLALGAFLAGLIISESEFAYQAISDILPFKDSFLGMFFVSVGMLLEPSRLAMNLPVIAIAVAGIMVVKIATTTSALLVVGAPLKASLHAGLGLAQVGEFSFVLAAAGRASGIISPDTYQTFLSASVITMLATPFLLRAAPDISAWLVSKRPIRRLARLRKEESFPKKKAGHTIIVGFGLNGRNLARVLSETGIPYVILDLNSETVRSERKKGRPIYYGDGSNAEILEKLGVKDAGAVVVAISDPASTRAIASIVKREHPNVHMIVRTKYVSEVEDLRALGADEVIPEEFETSIEIFSRVLRHYGTPVNIISEHIDRVRENSYRVLRSVALPKVRMEEIKDMTDEMETETYLVKDDSHLAGHSLRQLHLRAKTGAVVLTVRRGETMHQNPSPDFVLKKGDVVLLLGKRDEIRKALEYLESDKFVTLKYH